MPPGLPYTKYIGSFQGAPITFLLGPSQSRFDVHSLLLSTLSPLFRHPNGFPKTPRTPIRLPSVSAQDFLALFTWLYERKPPSFANAEGLKILVRLWIAAGKLGVWKTQNTILRLGMALMQPGDFGVDVETVRWVYENTAPGSKLRGFVIAVFCQRPAGGQVERRFFRPCYEGLGIFRDALAFLKVLGKVVMNYLVTGGTEIDWRRVEFRLPGYLVWGERGEDLPDGFFVTEEEAAEAAGEVAAQM
ncbi:hypothetical protein BU26DRAFT_437576 [Trematosphaeria pertusa]|uniref:BTB domain-containing protein n=1 Tax=Trematosphaeria pertusa TaxID=390896 RepID=A0A6A6HY30_9PLEO|nr:uncharacterized protein BU26DRAFT_437576 [Trematosphaeria pertusa]KAF2243124.1 hypothetical protein BU26DRAFT_437576 [Trematosphaeria pertusa]